MQKEDKEVEMNRGMNDPMRETGFKNAQVGDEVCSVGNGRGTIQDCTMSITYPLEVLFDNGVTGSFTLDGREALSHSNPSLFWPGSIKIDPQPRPKKKHTQKVKFIVEKHGEGCLSCNLYALSSLLPVGCKLVLTGEYEVEE